MEQIFYKYQGTGNDFILIDDRQNTFTQENEHAIKALCDRRFGIGADGLIILRNKANYDFEMIYYNADGNQSTMCGNGGRCMVRFAYDLGIKKNEYNFLAIDGPHLANIDLEKLIVRLKMIDVNTVDAHTSYAVLNTGSPHYVKFENNVRHLNVAKEGAEIRYSEVFAKEGINVNFVENTGTYNIYVRTYERGVEAETLSCGTGVTAAALVSAHNDRGYNQVQVQTIGGELSVEFNKIDDNSFKEIYLCGPAVQVFKGTLNV
jgi:diaminopimelate epimerase